ncbi:MAG: hypothetical protein HOE48_18810 [Candidatus Latescibacteria bacterium]|nr:hypothetical protein [Candidatus Latescibacterota bacterium]
MFTRPELMAIVAIGMVGSVVPASGITGFLVGVISTPFYFATPENSWADFYHPNLNSWMVPTQAEAVRGFFEGLRPGQQIPWSVWFIPLSWWATLIAAIFAVSASVMVILRRQWADNEKLAYPLVAVPENLIAGDQRFPDIFYTPLFWLGAAVPFSLLAWKSLSWFYPLLPILDVFPNAGKFYFTRYSPHIQIEPMNCFTIGFAYFANLQVLFSVWFFFLLHVVEGGIFNRIGYQIQTSSDSFSADPPTQAYQCFGALACLVIWRLWVARNHLLTVLETAMGRQPEDHREVLSYRTALIVLILGLIYVFYWLNSAGMDVVTAGLMIAAASVIYIGIARIVTEAGLVYAGATITPQAFAMDIRGTVGLSPQTLTAVALSYGLVDYMRGLFTPAVAHAVQIGDGLGANKRRLLFWICISILLGLLASVTFTLYLGYTHGAYNFPRFPFFSGDPKNVFRSTLVQMRTPQAADPNRLIFFGIGAGLMALLTFLRYRLSWWPLHPIGLALSSADNTAHLVMPVFIAWAAKSIIMKVGGVQLYQRAQPVFLGLIAGYTAGVVWCFVIDVIWFPGQGHMVHNW